MEHRCLVGSCKEVGFMGTSLTTLKRWSIKVCHLEGKLDLSNLEENLILFEFERVYEANKVLRYSTRKLGRLISGL